MHFTCEGGGGGKGLAAFLSWYGFPPCRVFGHVGLTLTFYVTEKAHLHRTQKVTKVTGRHGVGRQKIPRERTFLVFPFISHPPALAHHIASCGVLSER